MMADRYPELAEFLGSYFYPSSRSEYASFEAAIADFLADHRETEWPDAVVRELDALLTEPLDDARLTYEVFDGGPLGVRDGSLTVRDFLRWMRDQIAAGIGRSAAGGLASSA